MHVYAMANKFLSQLPCVTVSFCNAFDKCRVTSVHLGVLACLIAAASNSTAYAEISER